jgi:hypothetical protein
MGFGLVTGFIEHLDPRLQAARAVPLIHALYSSLERKIKVFSESYVFISIFVTA